MCQAQFDHLRVIDWTINGEYICYMLRNARFQFYESFSPAHDPLGTNHPLFSFEDYQEASRVLTFSYYEWYHFIPLLNHYEYNIVAPLYQGILVEMLKRGDLEGTMGSESLYIKMRVKTWSEALIPDIIRKKEPGAYKKLLTSSHRCLHPFNGEVFHQIQDWKLHKKRRITARKFEFDFSATGRAKGYNRCIHCWADHPCQADTSIHGPCTEEESRFRCDKVGGIHLCNKHGHQVTLLRAERVQGCTSVADAFKTQFHLTDGRVVPNMGILKYFHYLEGHHKRLIRSSALHFGMYSTTIAESKKVHPLLPLGINVQEDISFPSSFQPSEEVIAYQVHLSQLLDTVSEQWGVSERLEMLHEMREARSPIGPDVHVKETIHYALKEKKIKDMVSYVLFDGKEAGFTHSHPKVVDDDLDPQGENLGVKRLRMDKDGCTSSIDGESVGGEDDF